MDYSERACLCALNRIFGFIPQKGFQLYRYAGTAAAVFGLAPEELRACLGPHGALADRIGLRAVEEAARELAALGERGARFVGIDDGEYPALLRECADPPLGLYIRSATPPERLFSNLSPVAVVGTRKITPYGAEWCRRIVRGMAAAPGRSVVVSGLAFGTDVIAHRTALENGLPTIGVMATGIDSIYPRQHREIAERMASSPGSALLTDYPPGSEPVAAAFMRRNRIIAGLSRAVILIESRFRGGGLITARYTNDYARDLYALPGRADDECSQGCNLLIRDQRAEAITDVADLVHRLGLGTLARRRKEDLYAEALRRLSPALPAEEAARAAGLLLLVHACRGITLDQLCARSGLAYPQVSACVHRLEAEGFLSIDLLQRCCVNAKKL